MVSGWLKQILVLTLVPYDVVIIDSLPAHHATCIREAIKPQERACTTCRPIRPTSIQLKIQAQSRSMRSRSQDHRQPVGRNLRRTPAILPPQSAPTTSLLQAVRRIDQNLPWRHLSGRQDYITPTLSSLESERHVWGPKLTSRELRG